MTKKTIRKVIVGFVVAVLFAIIGFVLLPGKTTVMTCFITSAFTMASVALVYAIYQLVRGIIAYGSFKMPWRDLIRILTLVFVIVCAVILVIGSIRGCGPQYVKNQIVEKQIVNNSNVNNAVIDKAEIDKAEIDNAVIDKAEIDKAEIDNAVIDKAEIDNAVIDKAEIDKAEIDKAEIDKAEIDKAEIDKAEIDNAVIDKVEIKDDKTTHVCEAGEPEIVEATCTSNGYYKLVCKQCGKELYYKEYEATGHTYDGGKVTTEPTETTNGVKTYTCTKCGATKTESLDKVVHTCVGEAKVVEATCTSNGYYKLVCKQCGKELYYKEYEATGHTYDGGKVTTEPTETTNGVKTYTCTKCGATKTESLDKVVHTCVGEAKVVEATCTSNGYYKLVCKQCGKELYYKEYEATGHAYDDGKVITEATATTSGTKRYTCQKCGNIYDEEIPATGEVEVEFVISVSRMVVTGNHFEDIIVYTSANANDIVVAQYQKVFNYYVLDEHHLVLTVGDEDVFTSGTYIYVKGHEDQPVQVIRKAR